MIGIKVANGEFYPILEENSAATKRLVLTTVHNAQKSVQIDLFASETKSMDSARYIGTIVVENLIEKNQGDPSIELIITSQEDGVISAEAYDQDSPDTSRHLKLAASLENFEDKISDFELADLNVEDGELSYVAESSESTEDDVFTDDEKEIPAKKPAFSKKPFIIAGAAVLFAAILLLLWFFVIKDSITPRNLHELPPPSEALEGETDENGGLADILQEGGGLAQELADAASAGVDRSISVSLPNVDIIVPLTEETAKSAEIVEIVKLAEPQKKDIANGTVKGNPFAPVNKTKPEYPVPKSGTRYKMKWGDTLWDVSNVYYKNPWHYKFLARYNNIKNPNRIIAGRTIQIPPNPGK
ncbi:MAG: LysM peptidoglycan-binding domain-containing protein [Spirochaetaceae bacterium]|jgi:nucleoid-associated protein YgaU|nr:LysM peptidoglycan-binding domain-containing protein [Spirochaetaceae bacterium]